MKNRWLRFFGGLMILGLFYIFFASGITPPGPAGEVLRHNQEYDIDASPLFYTDVENMAEFEEGVAELRKNAELKKSDHFQNIQDGIESPD